MGFFFTTKFPRNKLFKEQANLEFNVAVNTYMQNIEQQGISIAERETPVGARGDLKNSIEWNRRSFLNADIAWTAAHARPVAEGSRPHFAPIRRLSEWTAVKWGDPGAGDVLQEIIVTRGTEKNPYDKRTKRAVKAVARRVWPARIRDFVRRIL
jgi:hypothetical protein